MAVDALHYNYLFVGKKCCDLTLLNDKVFLLIMDEVNPLLNYTNRKKCRISVCQYANQKEVKCGRPKWTKESLLPICQNINLYAGNDSFYFNFLSAEFPSIKSAYKQKNTVDIYLYLENDLCWGKVKSEGDCGLFISLREDIFEAAGEMLVMQVLENIYQIFDSAKVFFCKRSWWSNSSKEESALQDVAAWRIVDKLYKSNYGNWFEIALDKRR